MASCLVRAQDVSKAYRWVHLSHSHVHTHTHTHTHTNAGMHSHKKHTHTHTHTHTLLVMGWWKRGDGNDKSVCSGGEVSFQF